MSVILFSVKFKDESKLVAVSGGSSYDDFVTSVCGKWAELEKYTFNCLCDVGGITKCCLDSEIDFKNILLLCDTTSERLVLVEIISNVQTCQDHVENSGIIGDQHTAGVNFRSKYCDEKSENSEKGLGSQKGCSLKKPSIDLNTTPSSCSGKRKWDQCGKGVSGEGMDSQHRGNDRDGVDQQSGEEQFGSSVRGKTSGSDDVPMCSNVSQPRGYGNVECESDWEMPTYTVCPENKKTTLLSDEWANIIQMGVVQRFSGGEVEFRKELIKFATYCGFNFKYRKNNKQHIVASCIEEAQGGCSWFVKAKLIPLSNKFQIFKANLIHSCLGKFVCEDGTRLNSSIIADLVVDHVKNDHAIGGQRIVEELLHSYGIEAPYWKARRAIEKARDLIFGAYDDSYNQLRWYKKAIERTNPGSAVFLDVNQKTNRFERMFVAFKACVDGFRFCRPMLFIDATFMKGRAKGCLLSATAKDGENGLFPVALGVVSAETLDNWVWFLEKLRDEIKHDRTIAFISDRNLGLMSAFPLVWEKHLHFFCLFHLLTNLKGKFSRGCSRDHRANMVTMFTECAYAPNVDIFLQKLETFKREGGPKAVEWIQDLPVEKWAVAYGDGITRYGEMTSNAAESFNSWIRKSRYLPIRNMVDSIRKKLARWYVERRQQSSEWSGALCPEKEFTWARYTEFCKPWKVDVYTNSQYEVHSPVSATVKLNDGVCGCYQWQIRGFPCPHAVRVIRKLIY